MNTISYSKSNKIGSGIVIRIFSIMRAWHVRISPKSATSKIWQVSHPISAGIKSLTWLDQLESRSRALFTICMCKRGLSWTCLIIEVPRKGRNDTVCTDSRIQVGIGLIFGIDSSVYSQGGWVMGSWISTDLHLDNYEIPKNGECFMWFNFDPNNLSWTKI